MFANETLGMHPAKRIKAYDGMAVTADVWDAAHEYHGRLLNIHTHFGHGAGVLYGLEVISGDPPDRQVFVKPGIAVDHLGRSIILAEQRGYDLRSIDGQIYLVLTYGESQPTVDRGQNSEDAPRFVHYEYTLEALLALPPTPHVELARLQRESGSAPVRNAQNPDFPGLNELDLRYRRQIGANVTPPLSVAVVPLGAVRDASAAQGFVNLARSMRTASHPQVCVDLRTTLNGLSAYGLVYLVGQDAFRLNTDQMTALYDYQRKGGTLFYESNRQAQPGEPGGDAAFLDLVSSMGVTMAPLTDSHPLLRSPNFFAIPPDGFETQSTPRFLVGDGVLFSSYDYGSIWQGKRRGRPAARSEIRSAFEWGENILTYAAQRQQAAPASSKQGAR